MVRAALPSNPHLYDDIDASLFRFGFNGGSALSANLRAVQACIVTNLAASVGGLTWMLWDWRLERKWSAVGFCSGAIAGLVAITPGSGFVGSPAAVAYGFLAGTICNFATQLKFIFGYDDCLDIFASHAIGGIVGNVSILHHLLSEYL